MAENKKDTGASSTSKAKLWADWPHELPHKNDEAKHPIYEQLENPVFHAEMAEEHRQAVFAKFPESKSSGIIIKGGAEDNWMLYDSDTEICPFRQEAFFRYLFTINEPDCYGVLDLEKKESLLFIPRVSDDAERWNGERRELEYYVKRYKVSHAYWTKDMHVTLQKRGISQLFILKGTNIDSDRPVQTTPDFEGIREYQLEEKTLYSFLAELRLIKTQKEIDHLRRANLISSQAHVYVMRHIKPGMMELQCEALYKAWCCYYGAARHTAYTCICGSGAHGAILHYGHAGRPNDKQLKDGDRIVLDMGAEYSGYATDITRAYPVNGKFTADQKAIHNAVLAAQQAVLAAMKPGVKWPDMHQLAERTILSHLLKIGILKKHGGLDEEKQIEAMMQVFMGSVFMPHGLGHLLGLLVHDVGGYTEKETRSTDPGLKWLRCGRPLQAGMVITVEPGIYFNDGVLNNALKNKEQAQYIDETRLKDFRGKGGVRLEDDVLVTKDGCENLTVCPVTVEDIEEVMAEGRAKWSRLCF